MATPFLRSDSSASPPSSDHSASRRRSPRKPSDEGWHELQDQRARKLTKTMRGDVVVEYDSTTILDDDRGSQGHAFRVGSHFDDDFNGSASTSTADSRWRSR